MHPGMEPSRAHSSLYSSPAPPSIHPVPSMVRPAAASLELRINELNRRLRHCPDFADRWWWEQFAAEFFDDTANILISYCTPSEGEKHFSIGRAMIPHYFSSIFEGGVTEMYYTFSCAREYMSHTGPTLECDSALTTTQYLQPSFARVLVESKLSLQSNFDDLRIRTWSQYLIRHKEYVPRDTLLLSLQDYGSVESLLSNFTLFGINSCTLNFLSVSAMCEPIRSGMKEANYGMIPSDCVTNWPLVNHTNSRGAEPGPNCMMTQSIPTQLSSQPMADFTQSPVLSTRADSITSSERLLPTKSSKSKKTKRTKKAAAIKETPMPLKESPKSFCTNMPSPLSSCTPILQHHQQQQNVMVVGEPIPMGGEFGVEDERRITRLENNNSTEYLASSQHHSINTSIINGSGGSSVHSGFALDMSTGVEYDEPSITAALNALEQDALIQ